MGSDYKIIVVGTVLHEDCLLQTLIDDPEWLHLDLPLFDAKTHTYVSLHPDFMSTEQVKEMAEAHARRGELALFAMEFGNTVIPEDAPFKPEFFKRYHEDGSMTFDREIENIVLADPAKTVEMKSAFSAIVCLGVNLEGHSHEYKERPDEKRPPGIFVRDVISDRFYPEEFFEEAYKMCKRTGSRVIGVEVSGLDAYIQQPMENFFRNRSFYPEFIWLKSPAGPLNQNAKMKRVKGLSPFYRQGMIYHADNGCCNVLETQLLSFPRSKFWDVMDIFGYIVEMLESGDRFFDSDPNAKTEKQSDLDAIDRELELLDGEDYSSLNWRMV